MAAASLKALFAEYRENHTRAKELAAEARPFSERAKQIESEILERLQASGKTHHKAEGLLATISEKACSVSWASEFLARHGPDEVNRLKAEAGTKPELKIVEVS